MEPVFIKVTQTMADAEKYLDGKAVLDPSFGGLCDIGFWEESKDLCVADILKSRGCACYAISDHEFFGELAPHACKTQIFVFPAPEGDLVSITKRLWDDFIF